MGSIIDSPRYNVCTFCGKTESNLICDSIGSFPRAYPRGGEPILLGEQVTHKDPEKAKEYSRKWRERHPDKYKESLQRYKENNPGKGLEANRKWRESHREQDREHVRKWASANIEKKRAGCRKWFADNPEKSRDKSARRRALKLGTAMASVDLEFIWRRDGGICYLCGCEIDPKDVHFDHVVPLSKGGAHTADNIRAAHPKCNQKKGAKIIDLGQVVRWIQLKLL